MHFDNVHVVHPYSSIDIAREKSGFILSERTETVCPTNNYQLNSTFLLFFVNNNNLFARSYMVSIILIQS